MKALRILFVFLIFEILYKNGLADSKNVKEHKKRQAYLSPSATLSTTSSKNVLKEEIITIHEGSPLFDESSYGSGKLQIFEVHNHYKPSKPNFEYYIPEEKIRVQHVHQVSSAAPKSVSYSPNYQQSLQSTGRNPNSAEEVLRIEHFHVNQPHSGAQSIFSPTPTQQVLNENAQQLGFSSYLQPYQHSEQVYHNAVPKEIQAPVPYKGPTYLPPHNGEQHKIQHQVKVEEPSISQEHNQFRGPKYLPPHQTNNHQVEENAQYKEPDQNFQNFISQGPKHNGAQHQVQQTGQLKKSVYLPSHQVSFSQTHQQVEQTNQYKKPNYSSFHTNKQYSPTVQHLHQPNAVDHLTSHHVRYPESPEKNRQINKFKGPDYLPPHSGKHHSQLDEDQYHAKQPSQSIGFNYYLPPHQASSQEKPEQVEHINQFKVSDYLPPHSDGEYSTHNTIHHQTEQPGQYIKSDFIAPHQTHISSQENHQQVQQTNKLHTPHNNVDHQVQKPVQSIGSEHQANFQQNHQQAEQFNQYEGLNYLSPHNTQMTAHQEIQQPVQSQSLAYQTSLEQSSVQRTEEGKYKGPDYLPPHPIDQHSTRNKDKHPLQHSKLSNGPDHLTPHQPGHQESHQENPQVNQFKGSEYNSEHLSGQHFQYNNIHQHDQLKVSDFPSSHNNQQNSYEEFHKQSTQFKSTEYLAPHQTLKPMDHQINQQFDQAVEFRSSDSSPQFQINNQHESEQQIVPQQYLQKPLQHSPSHSQSVQVLTEPLPLPAGYDFEKPENAEESIAELHKLPEEETIPQPQNQQEYLQSDQFLPTLNSLSSYMDTIQPNVRYGATQFNTPQTPLNNYGPPAVAGSTVIDNSGTGTQQIQQQQHNSSPVAPMYNDETRSPHYAPNLPYATDTNAYGSQSTAQHQISNGYKYQSPNFYQQIQHNSPGFLTEGTGIQQSDINYNGHAAPIPESRSSSIQLETAESANQPISSRLRTVQIVDPSTVKTLKVIESSDQSGVKTIKILGRSQSEPKGDHHIVKVVTQNSNSPKEHVQTVKIFNDNNDAPKNERNAYLPPIARAVGQSPSTRQKQQHQQQQQQDFAGQLRNRY